jgi:hypothetical protein
MKTQALLLLSLFALAPLLAQNTPPQVSIQSVSVDVVMQQVTVSYDLIDAQQDDCEVWLKVSMDGGEFFAQANASDLSGDVGPDIAPGNSKTLVWNYAGTTANVYDTRIRVYASDHQALDIQTMVDQVSATELQAQLSFIEGVRHITAGNAHLNAVRDSLENAFLYYGLSTERHSFTFGSHTGQNILGRKTGAKDEAITFIIDGHYDSVANSPGADDNGSAVAGVLEVLRILSQYEFEHSIRFIGFDFEEAGLVGSQRYVLNGIKPYENIQGVLNFEMIGYYSEVPGSQSLPFGFDLLFPQAVAEITADQFRGNFLVVCGNTNSSSLIADYTSAAAQYVPELKIIDLEVAGNGQIAPDLRRSDHAPFWDSGRKALMITDGADTRNPYYHTPADTIGTLNFEFMTNVVKATLATLAELAVPISVGYDGYDVSVLASHHHVHEHQVRIDLFPNPTGGLLQIKMGLPHAQKFRLEVFDLQGRIMATRMLDVPQGESQQELDLQGLPAGSYVLVFQSGEGAVSRSLVIQ